MAQFVAPLALPIIGELLESNNNNVLYNEQQRFNESISRTLRDSHSDLLDRQTALGNEFRDGQVRFSAEIASINSRQDSFRDRMNANESATQQRFEMVAGRFNDVQNNFNRDITAVQNSQIATSARLDLVSDKYHELNKDIALRDRDNKTAFGKAFDQLHVMEKSRAGDLERLGHLEQKQAKMDKSMALKGKDYETALGKNFDRLNAMEKHRAEDLQRLDRVEARQQQLSFETMSAKETTADLKSSIALNASHTMMLLEKHNELDKAVALQDKDNRMAINGAYDQLTAMVKCRAGDLERFSGLENKHNELEKSIALRDNDIVAAFNKTSDRLNTIEQHRAGDVKRFDDLENKHHELERSVVRKDKDYETLFGKAFDQLSTLEQQRVTDLGKVGDLEDKHNELVQSIVGRDKEYTAAFGKTFDRLSTVEKYRASDLEKVCSLENRQQELTSAVVSTKKATNDLAVRVELNTQKHMMAMDNFNNQISNVDKAVTAFGRQCERLADDTRQISLETIKGQKETALVRHQLEQKAEEDKKAMNEIGARFLQVETHSNSTLKKTEVIEKEQEQLKNAIKAMSDKFKEYLVIGAAVGAVLYFSYKRGN